MSWSNRDLAQIAERDMSPKAVEKQLQCFVNGFDFLPVVAAATVGHGIMATTPEQNAYYAEVYRKSLATRKVVKFVPASGAATRMFKELFAFVGENKGSEAVNTLLARIDDFAFADELWKCVSRNADDKEIVSAIIGKGLEYGREAYHRALPLGQNSGCEEGWWLLADTKRHTPSARRAHKGIYQP